ncbi:aromatic acid exporter family protein [Frigoribacterium sp. Leaf186]|uniref:FUSC family protein n=1 Tax=Frigoribacterium sp. Leaf186 TaxID=1736293 RepID=UPI0006F75DAC|nr:aromatic acid exporter family protein [Frigoribacterium sp. Leaf186]KQS22449.1 hypothetical protein ASG05_02390 [Frigoribacterium sp. Leaf186]
MPDRRPAPPRRGGALRREARTATHWTRVLLAQPRLLLAVKTALAAALAYWIAPHVPGVAAEYPYYAPLGAVIAMYPTIKSSVRQGFQVLLGLVVGIVLATTVFALQEGQPGVLAVALVVGVGVLVAGIRWLGAGRDWVLTAGLFVLLLGGANAEAYSLGYVVQVGVGVVVGVVVNLVLVPPLYSSRADGRLARVRDSLADRADEIAGVFETTWPLEDDEWERRVGVLPSTLRRVREAVRFADESRHLNPRRLLRRRDLSQEYADLAVYERVSFHLQDVAEVSGILGRRIGRQIGMPDDLAPDVARAVHGVATVIRRHGTDDADAFTDARRRVADLWDAVDRHRDRPTTATSGGVSIAVSLGRVIAALDPDDTTAPRPEDDAAEEARATADDGAGGRVGGTDSTGPVDDDSAPRDTAPHDTVQDSDADAGR